MLGDLRDSLLLESHFLLGALLLLGRLSPAVVTPLLLGGTYLITSDGRSSSAGVSLFCWSLDISLAGYAIFLLEASLFCRASPTSA